jgi:hypothetical protein
MRARVGDDRKSSPTKRSARFPRAVAAHPTTPSTMNTNYRKALSGTKLDWFDARAAVDAIKPGAWEGLPYTARVHAENIVRRADPARIDAYLGQLIERKRDLDFPWFPHAWCATTSSARPRWSISPACATRSRSRAAIRRR